jgi:hypothetical protein
LTLDQRRKMPAKKAGPDHSEPAYAGAGKYSLEFSRSDLHRSKH